MVEDVVVVHDGAGGGQRGPEAHGRHGDGVKAPDDTGDDDGL